MKHEYRNHVDGKTIDVLNMSIENMLGEKQLKKEA